MSNTCNYGCSNLPTHQQIDCNDYAVGGISAVGLLECDHTITDFTNATQWDTNIASGKAKIILAVKGEIPAAAPVQVDNPVGCGSEQILNGFTNTVMWRDANVLASNDDLYASLNKRKLYVVVFMCEQDEIRVSQEPNDFVAVPTTVPMNNREMQMYNVTGTFFTKLGEIPFALYDAPAGIFS
jgi:hypothetical protein